MGKAALELGVITSALSPQINRLERELSPRVRPAAWAMSTWGLAPSTTGRAFMQTMRGRYPDVRMRMATVET